MNVVKKIEIIPQIYAYEKNYLDAVLESSQAPREVKGLFVGIIAEPSIAFKWWQLNPLTLDNNMEALIIAENSALPSPISVNLSADMLGEWLSVLMDRMDLTKAIDYTFDDYSSGKWLVIDIVDKAGKYVIPKLAHINAYELPIRLRFVYRVTYDVNSVEYVTVFPNGNSSYEVVLNSDKPYWLLEDLKPFKASEILLYSETFEPIDIVSGEATVESLPYYVIFRGSIVGTERGVSSNTIALKVLEANSGGSLRVVNEGSAEYTEISSLVPNLRDRWMLADESGRAQNVSNVRSPFASYQRDLVCKVSSLSGYKDIQPVYVEGNNYTPAVTVSGKRISIGINEDISFPSVSKLSQTKAVALDVNSSTDIKTSIVTPATGGSYTNVTRKSTLVSLRVLTSPGWQIVSFSPTMSSNSVADSIPQGTGHSDEFTLSIQDLLTLAESGIPVNTVLAVQAKYRHYYSGTYAGNEGITTSAIDTVIILGLQNQLSEESTAISYPLDTWSRTDIAFYINVGRQAEQVFTDIREYRDIFIPEDGISIRTSFNDTILFGNRETSLTEFTMSGGIDSDGRVLCRASIVSASPKIITHNGAASLRYTFADKFFSSITFSNAITLTTSQIYALTQTPDPTEPDGVSESVISG